MRKAFVLIGLAMTAAVVLLAGTVTFVLFDIDTAIKETIEESAGRAFKTDVRVGAATMSFKDGTGRIAGLTVASPPGFAEAAAIEIPVLNVIVDAARPAARAVTVSEAVLETPRVVLEIAAGKANLVRLRDSARAWVRRAENPDEAASEGQRLIVEQARTQGGTLVFRADFLNGGGTEVPLPDTRLTNIGDAQGALPAEVIEALIELLVTAAERAARRVDLDDLAARAGVAPPDIDLGAMLSD